MNRNRKTKDEKTSAGLGSQINYAIQGAIPHRKLIAGDISDKIPLALSDGRSVIYARPGSDYAAIKAKFEHRVRFGGFPVKNTE